jgi:hypothetical protein
MSTTLELIEALVEGATPVKTLRPPLTRACAWLALALLIVALLAAVHGLRPDLSARLPDRSNGWLWLPLPALAAWVSTIGYGCFADWVSMGPQGLQWGETARCFATVLLTSVPLGLALAVMVRHAALLRARAVAATGGLAVAALTAAGLSLLHPIEATAMILIWNAGIVALVAGLATVFGRTMLRWTAARFAPPESRVG